MSKKNPRIRLFVSAHKPTDYIKSDIIKPIQVGTALPGHERISGYLHDDDGDDNISKKNPRYCELTASYWAWKNDLDYDYVGFFHYRRYLSFRDDILPESPWGTVERNFFTDDVAREFGWNDENIAKTISDYDIIIPKRQDIRRWPNAGKDMRSQYLESGALHTKDLDIMQDVIREKSPKYLPYAKEYLSGHESIFCNVFIMKASIFKDYAKWLFDILDECDRRIDYSDYSVEAIRTPGHLAERLLNIYLAYEIDRHNYKVKESQMVVVKNTDPEPSLTPAFAKNNVPIVMSANDYYAPYLATAITSIRENSSNDHNYDIIIMSRDIQPHNQDKIKSILKNYPNFSLRFFSVARYEEQFARLFTRGHFTIETWFRLLMPKIMPDYDKALYIDSDLVVEADPAILYNTDIDGYLLAATHDADTAGLYNGAEIGKKDYMDKILKINKPYDYFQAGVILFNLAEFRKTYTVESMLKYAASYDWQLLDQDVLNNLAQGKVKFVDMSWNVMYNWRYDRIATIIARGPKRLYDEYLEARKHPRIVHYAGPDKPWNNPHVDFADQFWKYCKISGYYEQTIAQMIDGRVNWHFQPWTFKRIVKGIGHHLFPVGSRRGRAFRRLSHHK